MTKARVGLGRLGEKLAAERLETAGYEIVAHNYRCTSGEIDLIARHRGDWVFVEVRTRRGEKFGTPEESITPRKQAHLKAAAQTYLQQNQLSDVPWRVDVVAVELSTRGELRRVRVIEKALHD